MQQKFFPNYCCKSKRAEVTDQKFFFCLDILSKYNIRGEYTVMGLDRKKFMKDTSTAEGDLGMCWVSKDQKLSYTKSLLGAFFEPRNIPHKQKTHK